MFKKRSKKKRAFFLMALGLILLALNSNFFNLIPSLFSVIFFSSIAYLFFVKTASTFNLWTRIAVVGLIFLIGLSSANSLREMLPLLFIALAFVATYFSCIRCWWALIPAGVFSSLSLLVLLEKLFPSWDFDSVFLLGLGATFSLLYLLPSDRGGKRWAIYPAISLIFITVISNNPGEGDALAEYLPMILIVIGSALLWWWNKNHN